MLFQLKEDDCVSCLACVRVCPVGAVAVDGAVTGIIEESCIRCGICVPACPHDAIDVSGDFGRALELAATGDALLVLSGEAAVHFYPNTPEQVVNACYQAGFRTVHRGVIGDELVAGAYRELWEDQSWGTMIRSTCPVVVETIRKDYPELVPYLAPVKTPLAAEAAYLRARYSETVPIVYAGVCLSDERGLVDAALSFKELEELLLMRSVDVGKEPRFFERMPEEGRRYLSAAGGLPRSILDGESHTSRRLRKVRGLDRLGAIARAVTVNGLDLGFIDILSCDGCLDHPLLKPKEELFWRRMIAQESEPPRSVHPVVDPSIQLDLQIDFHPIRDGGREPEGDVVGVLDKIGSAQGGKPWDCGACGYDSCWDFANALLRGRATYRQCPPYQELQALRAQRAAALDSLTGLATHKVMQTRIRHEMARSRRSGVPFSVLFADLDRFKQVNDRFGHAAGSNVLVMVARVLERVIRSSDVAARYGGDEFVLILTGTDNEGARRVAEIVRQAVEEAGIERGFPEGLVTISVGVATFDPRTAEAVDVIEHADLALYRAKDAAGNCVA